MLTEAFTPPHKFVAQVRLKGIHMVMAEGRVRLRRGVDQPGIRGWGTAVVEDQHGGRALRNGGAVLRRVSVIQDVGAMAKGDLFASI